MGPGYFIIAILGCADGSTDCKPVATAPAQYATQSACAADINDALARNSDLDFPTLTAECRSVKAPASAGREPSRRQQTVVLPASARRS